jgi:hypothetical protein
MPLCIAYNAPTMTEGPIEKAIRQRQKLLTENSEMRAKIERNNARITELESALAVMRQFAPAGLPGLDEDLAAMYGDLESMTVPNAAARVLFKRGEGLTTREIVDVLIRAGKMPDTQTSMINLIGALKRNSHRFRKVGDKWELIETRSPVFEVIDSEAR